MIETFTVYLISPVAGLPALNELDIRIKPHRDLPVTPILSAVLDWLIIMLGLLLQQGVFSGLSSLRITAGTNDLTPLLRCVDDLETCLTLQSFHCDHLFEQSVRWPECPVYCDDIFSGYPLFLEGREPLHLPVLIDGVFKS